MIAEIVSEWGHIPSLGGCHGCLQGGEISSSRNILDGCICKM